MPSTRLPIPGTVASLLGVLILLGWTLAAFSLQQSFFASQKSLRLPSLGAATGAIFITHEWWRLLVSQFLHVHFLHMLFNASAIVILATAMERHAGSLRLLIIYMFGGLAGQIASVWYYPELVTDGASQALMALCTATLVLIAEKYYKLFALLLISIQIALDWHAIASIKAGHAYGMLAGLLLGSILLLLPAWAKPEPKQV